MLTERNTERLEADFLVKAVVKITNHLMVMDNMEFDGKFVVEGMKDEDDEPVTLQLYPPF